MPKNAKRPARPRRTPPQAAQNPGELQVNVEPWGIGPEELHTASRAILRQPHVRRVLRYMQRTAPQGAPTVLSKITREWLPKAYETGDRVHPFRKSLAALETGQTLPTHRRPVSSRRR